MLTVYRNSFVSFRFVSCAVVCVFVSFRFVSLHCFVSYRFVEIVSFRFVSVVSFRFPGFRAIWPESICWGNRKTAKCPLNVYRGKISMRGRGGAEVSPIGTLKFGMRRKTNYKTKVGRYLFFESRGFEIRNQCKKRMQNDVVIFCCLTCFGKMWVR